jgi:hypothetical protein
MPSSSARKCLIVLGMHRSGTSSLTGALHLTGLDIGKSIMPPADENPKGFFENLSLSAINDKILEELFNFWSDTLFIPEGWWKDSKFNDHAEQIIQILHTEFTTKNPILIKDPRLCIVLPLYLHVFEKIGMEPVFLICVRNPVEVAVSLGKRNNMPMEKSLLLWMDHHLRAEVYSRGMPRLFVSFNHFLENPIDVLVNASKSLHLELAINEQTKSEILNFLDPSLAHKVRNEQHDEISLFPELPEFFKLQVNAAGRDLAADEIAHVDIIRSRFSAMARFFNGLPGNYQATLTVHYENKNSITFKSPVSYGRITLKFNPDSANPMKKMVLRPCNSRVGLSLTMVEALSNDGSLVKVDSYTTNASSKNTEGMMLFDNDLPKITFHFEHPVLISSINIQINYHVFGTISSRKALRKERQK